MNERCAADAIMILLMPHQLTHTHTHTQVTHTTILQLSGFCPGQPG